MKREPDWASIEAKTSQRPEGHLQKSGIHQPTFDIVRNWRQSPVLDLLMTIAYMQAVDVYGFSLRKIDGGWQAIIKGKRTGHYLVAFVSCATFSDVLETTAEYAEKGILAFKPDRYPPKQYNGS